MILQHGIFWIISVLFSLFSYRFLFCCVSWLCFYYDVVLRFIDFCAKTSATYAVSMKWKYFFLLFVVIFEPFCSKVNPKIFPIEPDLIQYTRYRYFQPKFTKISKISHFPTFSKKNPHLIPFYPIYPIPDRDSFYSFYSFYPLNTLYPLYTHWTRALHPKYENHM